MVKGLIRITVFSILLIVLGVIMKNTLNVQEIHPIINWLIGFFWFEYIIIHIAVEFLRENIDIEYSMLLLASVSARLIIALFAFLIIAMTSVDDVTLFAINFSVLYLLFLVFEISSVLSNLRRNSSQDQIDD